MFHYFFIPLVEDFNFLNLFNYITFRAGGALFTAFLISIFFGQKLIEILKKIQKKGQPIRKDGPKSHLINKVGTPTMGGMLILISIFVSGTPFSFFLYLFYTLGIKKYSIKKNYTVFYIILYYTVTLESQEIS